MLCMLLVLLGALWVVAESQPHLQSPRFVSWPTPAYSQVRVSQEAQERAASDLLEGRPGMIAMPEPPVAKPVGALESGSPPHADTLSRGSENPPGDPLQHRSSCSTASGRASECVGRSRHTHSQIDTHTHTYTDTHTHTHSSTCTLTHPHTHTYTITHTHTHTHTRYTHANTSPDSKLSESLLPRSQRKTFLGREGKEGGGGGGKTGVVIIFRISWN
jgi:hypothetical protein